MRKITYKDVVLVKGWAKDFLIQIQNGAKIEGKIGPLDDGDQLAISYINAVLNLVGAADVKIELEVPDSESVNEY
jgi:hypothetical protein